MRALLLWAALVGVVAVLFVAEGVRHTWTIALIS